MKSMLFLTLGLGVTLGASAGPAALAKPQSAAQPTEPGNTQAYPDQSSVASKKPFASASLAAAKDAVSAKDLSGAQKLIGKPGAFQGTVSAVYSPGRHDVVILDFDPNYRQALTATVRPADYAKIPDLAALKGRHILVSGTFAAYKGKPEIEITDAAQIRLLP